MIRMEPAFTWNRITLQEYTESSGHDDRTAIFALGKATQFSDFKDVQSIFYETDEDTALRVMNRIQTDAMNRFPVSEISVIHRLGKIPVGDNVYAVMVWGRRMEDAFSACKFMVEEISSEVPMWKYEIRKSRELHYHLNGLTESSSGKGSF